MIRQTRPHKRRKPPVGSRVEAALRESEQRLRAIVETAVDAIVTIDQRGIIDSANAATQRMFGYRRAELIGRNVRMIMPQPYHSEHDGYIRQYLRTGAARIIGIGREVVGLRKNGTTFPVNLSVSEVRLGDRRLFTGILHDLSARRELENQVVEASVSEQRRIGQDLHDGLCQELVGVGIAAELLANQLKAKSLREADAARQLGDAARSAAAQARDMARGLNPVNVHSGGLSDALQEFAARVSNSFGVNCGFRSQGRWQLQDDAKATHIFRIAQEATSNAIRHGKATRINIDLKCADSRISLTINDNGSGLPPRLAMASASASIPTRNRPDPGRPGIGLQTMLFRARLIGGSLQIKPGRAGRGTIVACTMRRTSPPKR